MLRTVFSFALLSVALCAGAQDIQLHYDFGRNIYSGEEAGRPKLTATLEQFKADGTGSWYYFVDLDLSRHFTESAYAEISREFRLGSTSPFALHAEYNGGLSRVAGSFQQAALLGAAWNGHNADFSSTLSVQLMYKQYFKSYDATRSYASAQLTGVWSTLLLRRHLQFTGFIDFWRGEKPADGHGCLVVLTEPALWYNLTDCFSVGTEWEMSYNFVYNSDPSSSRTFFVNPTLGLRWKL